jgi:hypothetical protein
MEHAKDPCGPERAEQILNQRLETLDGESAAPVICGEAVAKFASPRPVFQVQGQLAEYFPLSTS